MTIWYQISVTKIKQIACRDRASVFLNDSGEVLITGFHYDGQLGINPPNDILKNYQRKENLFAPYKIPYLSNVIYIDASFHHTVVILNTNEVFATGAKNYGKLGIGYVENASTAFTEKIWIQAWIDDIIEVYCGSANTFFVNKYGELFGCGNNDNGQLGLPTTQKQYWVPTRIPI